MTIDDEWLVFLDNKQDDTLKLNVKQEPKNTTSFEELEKMCSNIYISTKTKILFLSKTINIFEDFWKIPIIDYNKQIEGITKKQIKVSFENMCKFLSQLSSRHCCCELAVVPLQHQHTCAHLSCQRRSTLISRASNSLPASKSRKRSSIFSSSCRLVRLCS
jgi:hypothetical protein